MAKLKKLAVSSVHQIFPVLLKNVTHQLQNVVDPADEVGEDVGEAVVVQNQKIKWLNWLHTLCEIISLLNMKN